MTSLTSIDLSVVFRLKLMALDTSCNNLLAVNSLTINLKLIRMHGWFAALHSNNSADTTGVVLRNVVLQGRLTGVSPQVVKLEGDFVVGVNKASVMQDSMLCSGV